MTKKQIDNISFTDALKILESSGAKVKIDFNTREADVKAAARKILRDKKKKAA